MLTTRVAGQAAGADGPPKDVKKVGEKLMKHIGLRVFTAAHGMGKLLYYGDGMPPPALVASHGPPRPPACVAPSWPHTHDAAIRPGVDTPPPPCPCAPWAGDARP